MHEQPQPMPQEDQDLYQEAGHQEAAAAQEATLQYLQGRVVALNVEVRRRDARIATLEAELADARNTHVVPQPDASTD